MSKKKQKQDPPKWSDKQRWFWDFLKSLLVFAVISFFTVNWLDDRTRARDREQFEQQARWTAKFKARNDALRHFSSESSLYLSSMDDAFLVAYQGEAYLTTHVRSYSPPAESPRVGSITDYGKQLLIEWHDVRWPHFDASLNDVEAMFVDCDSVTNDLQALRQLVEKIDDKFDCLRDKRNREDSTRNKSGPEENNDEQENDSDRYKTWMAYKTSGVPGSFGAFRTEYERLRKRLLENANKALFVATQ